MREQKPASRAQDIGDVLLCMALLVFIGMMLASAYDRWIGY